MARTARESAAESLRILVKVFATFPDGSDKSGSGFVAGEAGTIFTCAHVVTQHGERASRVEISQDGSAREKASITSIVDQEDVAVLSAPISATPGVFGDSTSLYIGDSVVFAGYPTGVQSASVFSAMVSARGVRLVNYVKGDVVQLNGMINYGNSGGPVLSIDSQQVVGMITAKNVPFLVEIDKLMDFLRAAPVSPGTGVIIMGIRFGEFFNFVIQALRLVSGSLRQVQVGIGYAIPAETLSDAQASK